MIKKEQKHLKRNFQEKLIDFKEKLQELATCRMRRQMKKASLCPLPPPISNAALSVGLLQCSLRKSYNQLFLLVFADT